MAPWSAEEGQIERFAPRGLAAGWVTSTSDVVLATYGGESSATEVGAPRWGIPRPDPVICS